MHGKEKLILKNSTISFCYQIINALIQFVIRSLIIKYIGIEILGIGSTFNSILGALSLADLGFQTAIVYRLYKPLKEDNKDEIIDLLNVFKYIYVSVGFIFLLFSAIFLFLIPYVIKGIQLDFSVYLIFALEAIAPSVTYFLSYKRSLLYADQRDYITKLIDIFVVVIFSVLEIFAIIYAKSFYGYLLFLIFQNIVSNLVVHFYCNKHYPELSQKRHLNNKVLKTIMTDTKDVFAGKFSGYIYSSTDNIVISAFINTTSVGYFVNYTMITKQISLLINSVLNPVAPFIGRMIAEDSGKGTNKSFFELYTFIRFILACVVVIPTIVLLPDFISLWLGDSYLLKDNVSLLLGLDMFISLVYAACYDFSNGSGLFKKEKMIMLIGAILNITISIALTYRFSISGVLIGTVITQFFFWFSRSYVAIKYSLNEDNNYFYVYWIKCIHFIVTLAIAIILCYRINVYICFNNGIITFLIKGIIDEIIILIIVCISFCRDNNFIKLLKMFMTKIYCR